MTSERREAIKLYLEYVKTVTSFAIFGTLLFAALQWRISNQTAKIASDQATIANEAAAVARVQRAGVEWRDHLRLFVDKPELRPFFESGQEIKSGDDTHLIHAVADLRLHVIDVIMDYQLKPGQKLAGAWKRTFVHAFRSSPALCARWKQTKSNYETDFNDLGEEGCATPRI